MRPQVWAAPVLALLAAVLLTLGLGAGGGSPVEVAAAIFAPNPEDPVAIAVREIRLPRLLAGALAGAALGAAGALMQAVTRNPLADPGLMGVNAGAAAAVVFGALVFGNPGEAFLTALAFPGAALAAGAVFLLGGGAAGEAGPLRLTLAGIALNAFLSSLIAAAVLTHGETLEVFRFWAAGTLAQAQIRPLESMALAAGAGAVLGLLLAPRLEALAFGEDLARGLGANPGLTRFGALTAIALTTGAAVSVAGPISFLGLLAPPLARRLSGHDLRGEILASALLGAALLLLADTAGRLVLAPAEVRVGIMTALIGGPAFLWVARGLRIRRRP